MKKRLMTRLNLETSFFCDPRLNRLERLIERTKDLASFYRFAAIGILAQLWHQSQSRLQTHATAEQIEDWTGPGAATILAESGFLIPAENGQFEIRGNDTQLAQLEGWLDKKRSAGKKGAEKRWSSKPIAPDSTSVENNRTIIAPDSTAIANDSTTIAPDSTAIANDSTRWQNIAQFNSIQFNSIQTKKIQLTRSLSSPKIAISDVDSATQTALESLETEEVSKKPKKAKKPTKSNEPSGVMLVWNAYCESMAKHWSMWNVPRSAKVMGCAKRLIELVGIENAVELARYYPTRRKAFYVQAGHKFELLVSDYMALLREMNAGIKLTHEVVKEIVQKEDSENFQLFTESKPVTNPLLMDDEQFAEYEQLQQSRDSSLLAIPESFERGEI